MTPHRERRKDKATGKMVAVGTYILDRTIRGVGRIKVASGTSHLATFNRLNEMIDGLRERGRFDLLRSIKDGTLAPLVVWDAYRVNRLESLPSAETLVPLIAAMRAWSKVHDCGDDRRRQLKYDINHIESQTPKDAPLTHLPAAITMLRASLGVTEGKRRAFNQVRSTALAFAATTLKRSSAIWRDVQAVDPLTLPAQDRNARPLELDEMRALFPNRQTDPFDAIAWGMATTGMGQKEYWGRWSVKADRVHIAGTKRSGRVRDVPLVLRPAVPRMHRRTFENKLRERTTEHVAYDLRRTYAHWMEQAGILRSRRQLYMGHGTGDVTGLYERHEVTGFLVEDARRLRVFLGLEGEAMRVVKSGDSA